MNKAVVLGATGGMGYALVNELMSRKIPTVAFARNKEKLQRLYGSQEDVQIISGDAYQLADLISATEGADIIFHTVSIPYPDWSEGHPQVMKNVLAAAKRNSCKVVIIDNIYAYGKREKKEVTEETPKQPHTKKGQIRLKMEKLAKDAHKEGIPTLIAHFPDFYGPNAENTMLHYTLDSIVKNKVAIFVGSKNVKREYIFTPDGAKAAVELALRESAYGQNWNIPGYGVISGLEILDILKKYTGYQKHLFSAGRKMISCLGLFSPMMREVVEMMYLTEEPVVLSGAKYEREIGPLPKTSYEEGLQKTVEFMRNR